MINIFSQAIDTSAAANTSRDVQALCKQVNDFVKNPTVLLVSTELRTVIDSTDAITLFVKVDYNMKSTGG